MLGEVAENVAVASVPRCGHWIAEERPEELVGFLLRFVGAGSALGSLWV